jgi:hypothetical protein
MHRSFANAGHRTLITSASEADRDRLTRCCAVQADAAQGVQRYEAQHAGELLAAVLPVATPSPSGASGSQTAWPRRCARAAAAAGGQGRRVTQHGEIDAQATRRVSVMLGR